MMNVKVLVGDLKDRVLRCTGVGEQGIVTVEYVEVSFSYTKDECVPWVRGETMSWEAYDQLRSKDNEI